MFSFYGFVQVSWIKKRRKLPSGFSTMAIELTQLVGSSALRITARFSMSFNSAFTLSRRAAGILLGGFITGETVGSISVW